MTDAEFEAQGARLRPIAEKRNETRQKDEDWLDHEERVATTLANAFIWLKAAVEDEVKAATGGTDGQTT